MHRLASLLVALLAATPTLPDASIPTADIAGAADSPLVGRLDGALIVSYSRSDFDEATYPISILERVDGPRDDRNNVVYRAAQSVSGEGQRTRIVYVMAEGTSPLQVIRSYQDALSEGDVRYECRDTECGGSPNRSSGGGGGEQSLAMTIWPERRVTDDNFSNGECAQTNRLSEQRYTLIEIPQGYVSVHAYVLNAGSFCDALDARTVAVLDILQTGEMKDTIVTVSASDMAGEIAQDGKIALYGITFATGSAEITGESAPTIDEIAALLRQAPDLRLLIVGHTDSEGSFDYNQGLSERRAASVVDRLVSAHGVDRARLFPVGVSFASPVATNATEEGRAQNRRVELVSF